MESLTAEAHLEPQAPPTPAAGWTARLRRLPLMPLAAAAVVALACALAAQGGWFALLSAAVGSAAAAALVWRADRSPAAASIAADPAPDSGNPPPAAALVDEGGARLMVSRVVPVWRRQLETARGSTEESFNEMVQAFARVADGLSTLASQAEMAAPANAGAGAVDEVIEARPEMIDELLRPMRRAVQQRDEAARALTEGAESLRQLDRAAKECKALARHTRMVATNASIEAKRHGGHGNAQEQRGRFDAVAAEIRTLGDRNAELGEQLQRALADLTRRFEPLRRHAELHDITEDELHLEARIQARKVLAGLMTDLGRSLQASHEMRALATQMRDDVDAVFLGFQAGDRVGQMLDILERDVRKLIDWNATRASASHADADAWLAELEQSYTMTEQRNQHHNTVSVDTDAGVEFF